MSPYRHNVRKPVKKLPRLRARIRGLVRRVILPAQVIGALFGVSMGLVSIWNAKLRTEVDDKTAIEKLHYHDWEEAVTKRQATLDEDVKKFNASMAPEREKLEKLVAHNEVLKGTLEMKIREADYHRELQVPMLIRGWLTAGSPDFHGLNVPVAGEAITCYIDRGDSNKPKINCIKSKDN